MVTPTDLRQTVMWTIVSCQPQKWLIASNICILYSIACVPVAILCLHIGLLFTYQPRIYKSNSYLYIGLSYLHIGLLFINRTPIYISDFYLYCIIDMYAAMALWLIWPPILYQYLTFAFMHPPYLVCILFGMPSLYLFTFLMFFISCIYIYIHKLKSVWDVCVFS